MREGPGKTVIEQAANRLRSIVLDQPAGTLIGSEEALITALGCSRSTVRQVARLLEREGLLQVRRGINGGYFGARPSAGTIEATVSAYLETLEMDPQDVTIVASALWVEAMRKAAVADRDVIKARVEPLIRRVKAMKAAATFDDVQLLETDVQAAIFELGGSEYIKLIFDINVAFSRRNFASHSAVDDRSAHHLEFVRRWRDAKLLELDALDSGDRELAALAAQHSRKIWHRRIRSRFFAD